MIKDIKKYLSILEDRLADFYVATPQLANYIERPLFKYLPVISLLFGVLSLISAYNLWQTAHSMSVLINYANTNSGLYSTRIATINHHLGPAFWLSLLTLVAEGYIFFKAYGGLKRQLKAGWDLIYYAFVLNVIYGIVMLFSVYGGLTNLFERLIFSLFCLYFLFELRDQYITPTPKPAAVKPKKVAKKKVSQKTVTKKKT